MRCKKYQKYLIIDRKQYKELLEIKYGETFKQRMLVAIEQIIEEND